MSIITDWVQRLNDLIAIVTGGQSSSNIGSVDHIPALTATAATVTAGSYISWLLFRSAAVTVVITGANLTAGDIQINTSNDAGTTVGAWTTLGSLTGGATETKLYNISTSTSPGSGGSFFQIRLANGTGTFTSTSISVQVVLT